MLASILQQRVALKLMAMKILDLRIRIRNLFFFISELLILGLSAQTITKMDLNPNVWFFGYILINISLILCIFFQIIRNNSVTEMSTTIMAYSSLYTNLRSSFVRNPTLLPGSTCIYPTNRVLIYNLVSSSASKIFLQTSSMCS